MRAPLYNPVYTGLTITNPLVLYRSLLASKAIDPDPAQHRLALHLQKLYFRLKDYSPEVQYGPRLEAFSRAVEDSSKNEEEKPVAVPGHPLRRNPFFSHLFAKKPGKDTLALTRVLTNHEAAIVLDSPKGLLLHGEVGTGKSMLLDLLADSLPNPKKRRFHFNTFMLETFARLEQLRRSRLVSADANAEYSLLWLARDMIDKSPILFLDEFQLPDKAASKILSNLFTSFFQLGGVLIASSNRMPDELSKASGMDFTAPPPGSVVRNWLGLGRSPHMGLSSAESESARFVKVLRARCEIWDMEGSKDWRRRDVRESAEDSIADETRDALMEAVPTSEDVVPRTPDYSKISSSRSLGPSDQPLPAQNESLGGSNVVQVKAPRKYLLRRRENDTAWHAMIKASLPSDLDDHFPWDMTALLVYGREIRVPRHLAGVSYWDFGHLCGGNFGPADYITLASTFHTFIVDDIPVLTLLQRNEARRLITLLDALYEARCKLIVRADAGPDDVFFPEIPVSLRNTSSLKPDENDGGDAVYPETMSEIYQDQTTPFRPNVSSYTDGKRTKSSEESVPGSGNEIGRQVDFGMTSSFTGEDERFAYKRARSRLWEMCGARWHARAEPGWWRPLPLEVRRWERRSDPERPETKSLWPSNGDVQMGKYIELDSPAGLDGAKRGDTDDGDR